MSTLSKRMHQYFQGWADRLAAQRDSHGIFANKGDAGTAREDALASFIKTHLPLRCRISKGGFIFDYTGNESKQLDLIITNDLSLQFEDRDSGKSFSIVEGAYCAISVKTSLNKRELYDALQNLASIPTMPQMNVILDQNISHINRATYFELPFGVIFSYDGLSPEKTLQHLEDFFASNQIDEHRRPTHIIVNNKYLLIRVSAISVNCLEDIPPAGYKQVAVEQIGSYSLLSLLCAIQAVANYGGSFRFSTLPYLNLLRDASKEKVVDSE